MGLIYGKHFASNSVRNRSSLIETLRGLRVFAIFLLPFHLLPPLTGGLSMERCNSLSDLSCFN